MPASALIAVRIWTFRPAHGRLGWIERYRKSAL